MRDLRTIHEFSIENYYKIKLYSEITLHQIITYYEEDERADTDPSALLEILRVEQTYQGKDKLTIFTEEEKQNILTCKKNQLPAFILGKIKDFTIFSFFNTVSKIVMDEIKTYQEDLQKKLKLWEETFQIQEIENLKRDVLDFKFQSQYDANRKELTLTFKNFSQKYEHLDFITPFLEDGEHFIKLEEIFMVGTKKYFCFISDKDRIVIFNYN